MDLRTVLLLAHISAGCLGLFLGAGALLARRRRGRRGDRHGGWHVRLGLAYQAVVALMTTTAVVLAATAAVTPWGLVVIAVATEAAAITGWIVARRRRPGWLAWHISLMCGSYVSFITAALMVNWSSPLAWLLPTLIGSPLIAWIARAAGTRPPVIRQVAGARLDS